MNNKINENNTNNIIVKTEVCPLCGGNLYQVFDYDFIFHCDTCEFELDNN